jgi:hypothetical protein
MTTNISGSAGVSESATIYTFPPRGRFARGTDETMPAANVQVPRGVKLVTGTGWYHDEAIQQSRKDTMKSDPFRKN